MSFSGSAKTPTEALGLYHPPPPKRAQGFDLRTSQTGALNASNGREAGLQGPESRLYRTLHCEREKGFTAPKDTSRVSDLKFVGAPGTKGLKNLCPGWLSSAHGSRSTRLSQNLLDNRAPGLIVPGS